MAGVGGEAPEDRMRGGKREFGRWVCKLWKGMADVFFSTWLIIILAGPNMLERHFPIVVADAAPRVA